MEIKNIVILTGAGISAESGLATFRASDGLWCGHRIEEVATPEGYAKNPALVQHFYNTRRRQLAEVAPNAAHHALAKLAAQWPGNVLLVTQNVDDLHQRALVEAERKIRSKTDAGDPIPSPSGGGLGWGLWGNSGASHAPLPTSPQRGEGFQFIAMHGELKKARCRLSGEITDCETDLSPEHTLRPHIVWFGEMPLEMDVIGRALRQCDLFVSIGTSGNVYPAAGFVAEANEAGAHTIEINLEPSLVRSHFDETRYGPASALVPQWVDEVLTAS